MADQIFNWPPLESNPEVFTQYLHKIGMSEEWVIGEVFGFDDELLSLLPQPVVGVIVAIEKINKDFDQKLGNQDNYGQIYNYNANICLNNFQKKNQYIKSIVPFYMKQHESLDNACGIIACLHSVFNNLHLIEIQSDSVLESYFKQVQNESPEVRANILDNSNQFKEQHKEFANQGQSALAEQQNDIKHHFVAFVINAQNQLVELDGTKNGPYVVQENCQDLLKDSIKEIQKRLESQEISESLSMMTLNKAY